MYNPYYPYAQYNPYTQQNTMNILPQQQVIQVNGNPSNSIQMYPNSSLLAMDTSAPIVWLCISDGVGKVTATPYDIKLHEDAPAVDTTDLEQRIKTIEDFILELEASNDKPHVETTQSNKSKSGRD